MESNQLNAIIIGATGACGRELVDLLLDSNEYQSIIIPVRRKITRWDNLSQEQSSKLKMIIVENLDFLGGSKEEIEQTLNISSTQQNSLFCCLGSRVGRGTEEFRKVDYTYPVLSCELCEKLNISHFTLISASGAKRNSCFLYMRTKGEVEEEVLKKNVNYISIIKPGLILNRDNDKRCMESCFACFCCCYPSITARNVARAMMIDDLLYQKKEIKEKSSKELFTNDLLALIKEYDQGYSKVPIK